MSLEQLHAGQNGESVQEVSKQAKSRHAKTDVRYWEQSVFRPSYTRGGEARILGELVVKIQHLGRRETFSLGTANKAAAAAKAKEVYLTLKASGWGVALERFKPTFIPLKPAVTLAEFISEVKEKVSGRGKTIEGYCRALRTIAADVFGIDGGTAKYDYRTGGRAAWIAKVEAVRLADLAPELVQKWKLRFLRRAGDDVIKQRAARISVNSLMRQARSLFAPAMLKFICLEVQGTNPFEGVEFEPRQSMRFRSSVDLEEVIKAAVAELPEPELKIFLLAVMAGLRRDEIDKLEWDAFQWGKNVIRIEATQFAEHKSEESNADVQVDAELVTLFRGYHARKKGRFVIESKNEPRPGATYSHYRCERHFEALVKWLRKQGVKSGKPLHALRKEYGSQIAAKHGIHAASHALRHADINITAAHYLDQKERVTSGMGHLLGKPENVVPMKAIEPAKITEHEKAGTNEQRIRRSTQPKNAALRSSVAAGAS